MLIIEMIDINNIGEEEALTNYEANENICVRASCFYSLFLY
jgi:hypothetical protein